MKGSAAPSPSRAHARLLQLLLFIFLFCDAKPSAFALQTGCTCICKSDAFALRESCPDDAFASPCPCPGAAFSAAPRPQRLLAARLRFSDFSDAAWAVSMLRLIRDSEKKQPSSILNRPNCAQSSIYCFKSKVCPKDAVNDLSFNSVKGSFISG